MAKMTEQEFVKVIKEKREAYIQAAVDYMDALERLDFKTAMEHSMSAADILGMDVMAYLMDWYNNNDTEDFDKRYMEVTEQLEEAMKTDEERFFDNLNKMEVARLKERAKHIGD